MMLRPVILTLLTAALVAERVQASELRVLPGEIALSGPQASQRLLVVAEESGKVVGDRTSLARFASSDEAVVKIDARGVVQAVGDGEATITARQDGKSA